MQLKLSPAVKGLITALLMIAVALIIDANRETANPRMQYLIFIVYGIGIVWTLLSFRSSAFFSGRFTEMFGQGFRCFIIVTLVMVIFTAVFIRMHPEFAEQEAAYQKEQLIKTNDKTPVEIEDLVAKVKKQYPIRYISASIFGYLIVGAAISAAASALLIRRK
jgi:energy-coupling factor transporter transmembrane protein EcfT